MSRTSLFREAWDQAVLRTESPNGMVVVENRADREIRVRVDDGYFHRATRGELEQQVGRALKLAFVDRTRAYNRQREDVLGIAVRPIDGSRSPHVADFVRKRDGIVAEGASGDGLVRASAVGMREFFVTIDPAAWAQGRAAVESALSEACTSGLRSQFAQMLHLKREGH